MAKFELKFLDCFGNNDYLTCEKKQQVDEEFNEHWINISISNNGKIFSIMLDKSTAIKFSKTLRTEINKITELEGGQNGSR